jgi:cell wall-associated NlpC family hydrolase
MIDFCRRQATTKQGQIKISLLFSVIFICFAVIGMTVFAQPYAVYATGEKVADPWVVSVDGNPVVVVDSEEAGEAVETGLRMHYAGGDFEAQQDIKMLNEITVTKYSFDNAKTHPVVMNGAEAVDYIIALNETSETPVVGFETTRYTTAEEEIAYDTIELEDDEFAQGETQVTQEGVNGKREITSLETLVNGEVVATEVVEETVIEEPVDKVVVTGTKEPEPEPEPEAVSSGSSSGSSSGGSGGHAAAGGGLSTAYDMIGVPYVWGGTSTSGVDCSGLVNVCYGGARGRTTYAMIGSLQSTGDWKTSMSELNVGDLVFPHSGHVGIYIGDGMMIHAPSPGRSVCIAPVYSFYGGGPY